MMKFLKYLLLTFASFAVLLFVSLVIAEIYLRRMNPVPIEWVIAQIHQPDSELGYSGIPGASGIDSTKVDGIYQFNVNLKLNKNGFREVSGQSAARGDRCLLIVGDSLAFGIGVLGPQTTASILQKSLKNTRVYNLGYSGYGPHQTLRLLEIGREKPFMQSCKEIKAYYFGVEDNFWRALGRANWGLSAPLYKIEQGALRFKGPIFPQWVENLNNEGKPYKVVQALTSRFLGYGKEVPIEEQQLYRKIFQKMNEILMERYRAKLKILYFTQGRDPGKNIFRKLEVPGLETVFFEDLAKARAIPLNRVLSTLYLRDKTHMNEVGNRFLADTLLAGDLKDWRH